MIPNHYQRAVGVFANRQRAETALQELRNAGFAMDRVSVITRDRTAEFVTDAGVVPGVGNKVDESATAGAVTGGALGTLTGLLVGLGAIAIPGLGPVVVGGAAATALITTLTGGVVGAASGGLLGALLGLGIPEEQAKIYRDRIHQGDYLVMIEGSEPEIRHAEAFLARQGIQQWGVYGSHSRSTSRNAVP